MDMEQLSEITVSEARILSPQQMVEHHKSENTKNAAGILKQMLMPPWNCGVNNKNANFKKIIEKLYLTTHPNKANGFDLDENFLEKPQLERLSNNSYSIVESWLANKTTEAFFSQETTLEEAMKLVQLSNCFMQRLLKSEAKKLTKISIGGYTGSKPWTYKVLLESLISNPTRFEIKRSFDFKNYPANCSRTFGYSSIFDEWQVEENVEKGHVASEKIHHFFLIKI